MCNITELNVLYILDSIQLVFAHGMGIITIPRLYRI